MNTGAGGAFTRDVLVANCAGTVWTDEFESLPASSLGDRPKRWRQSLK
jgi:hypothetical protein